MQIECSVSLVERLAETQKQIFSLLTDPNIIITLLVLLNPN